MMSLDTCTCCSPSTLRSLLTRLWLSISASVKLKRSRRPWCPSSIPSAQLIRPTQNSWYSARSRRSPVTARPLTSPRRPGLKEVSRPTLRHFVRPWGPVSLEDTNCRMSPREWSSCSITITAVLGRAASTSRASAFCLELTSSTRFHRPSNWLFSPPPAALAFSSIAAICSASMRSFSAALRALSTAFSSAPLVAATPSSVLSSPSSLSAW
mmetsp:Transcript_11831/g.37591  ORF Transcript_11831/g.37591 Transcript_11831/m.37591 type:complete len:211 (-) Transcript_11831:1895-2527(-)